MKKTLRNLMLTSLLFVAAFGEASAAVYTFEYSYDGASVTPITAPYGTDIEVGDVVKKTVSAVGGYWTTTGTGTVWSLIGVADNGTRIGDAFYYFYNDSALVHSTSLLGADSSSAHIIDPVTTPSSIVFDTLKVDYILTATDSVNNRLDDGFETLNDLMYMGGATFTAVTTSVPEPASFAILGLGLAGMAAVRRRK